MVYISTLNCDNKSTLFSACISVNVDTYEVVTKGGINIPLYIQYTFIKHPGAYVFQCPTYPAFIGDWRLFEVGINFHM